ncbi:ABC transporter permease/M1 family aminopeptidase [Flavobacterium cerinum]|uniref:Aminopeptidase n=1 Tax=Flavobacterium cerinum TaxID=2502784 RepID=A0ABY5IR37_9FLAO|nr:M1 family aminopeptidase [Flavobacterium cerinum]UUC43849.1 aminopeptidase [Flavobacterium cerinum]
MITEILKFDWNFFAKKRSFPVMLLFFLSFGIFTTVAANFPFPETYRNAPYTITYIIGVMSLINIFTVTLLAAQGLLRESDTRFDSILYATPIRKRNYLGSRFITIFLITVLTFGLYGIGLFLGHQLFREHPGDYTNTGIGTYLYAFSVLALPNILFCTGIICSIGVLTRNKIAIYISGLFIYFLYWGIAMFANSPLLANASPVSDKTMQLMARIDPFGLSAFFEQTRYWSALERNNEVIALQGDFLFNRLLFIAIAFGLVGLAYKRFTLSVGKQKTEKQKRDKEIGIVFNYQPIKTKVKGYSYDFRAWFSFVKTDVKAVFKTVPIWIMLLGWVFFLAMEIAGNINAGVRLPERFATTALMIGDILKLFPIIGLLIVLFYGSEIYWRSHSSRFDALEKTTPVSGGVVLLAKVTVLSLVPIILIAASIVTGLVFQWVYNDAIVDWGLYLSLFYLIGLPLMLSAAFVIGIQSVSPNRYIGLIISSVLLLLTNTSLGGMFGMTHPLWRFANAYQGNYSEMTGFDIFITAFHIKMIFWTSVTTVFLIGITTRGKHFRKIHYLLLLISLTVAGWSGIQIVTKTTISKKNERNDWKQEYEVRYKKYESLPQPIITDVKTDVALFPEKNAYTVTGIYTLINKNTTAIDSVLVYADKDFEWSGITISGAKLVTKDTAYGHYWYRFASPLQPGQTTRMHFHFSYSASAFNDFIRFNTIVQNGTFIRISNFYPGFGYRSDNEIEDHKERKKRGLEPSTLVIPLERKTDNVETFINLDMTIATASDQTAIGLGTLKKKWKQDNRQYFHYSTESPIPFRFVVTSARYAVKKLKYRDIALEVYYHPEHDQNIDHLIKNAKYTLDYCEENFSRYPYKILRFAEISSFTKGFAGTAYPTGFFINETFGFRNKAEQNPEKDIINEMVSHELAHTWWGNAMINPDYREGSKLLTETLAMYTELMVYKKTYGSKNLRSRVAVHRDLYFSGRSFTTEEPLYRSYPDKSFLCYDKGMVVMYQLEKRIGEQQLNKALRSLLNRYAYPKQPPTANDLLQEFYRVSPPEIHSKIDEWFKTITTYDLALEEVSCTKDKNGTYDVKVKIAATQYKEDGNGNRKEQNFTEPIEIEISYQDGTSQLLVIPKEQFGLWQFKLKQKPVAITLDPNLLFLEMNTEDNHKTL